MKERAARLGSGWRLLAVLLTLQLPTTEDEQGTAAPAAPAYDDLHGGRRRGVSAATGSGEGRRHDTLTRAEAAKRGRVVTGRGALGSGVVSALDTAVGAACEVWRRLASDTGAAVVRHRNGRQRGRNGVVGRCLYGAGTW
jgi:hypothetical protein